MKKATKLIRSCFVNGTTIEETFNRVIATVNPHYRYSRCEEEYIKFLISRQCNNDEIISLMNVQPRTSQSSHWSLRRIQHLRECLQRSINVQPTTVQPITTPTQPIRIVVDSVPSDQSQSRAEVARILRENIDQYSVQFANASDESPKVETKKRTTKKIVKIEKGKWDYDLKRTWGVEIEFTHPNVISVNDIRDKLNSVGLKSVIGDRSAREKTAWKFTNDSSVIATLPSYSGGKELVSPILQGNKGLEQLKKVSEILKFYKCKVNYSCGLHVHHGVIGYDGIAEGNVWQFFRNLLKAYDVYKSDIGSILPQSRRQGERYTRYCENLKRAEVKRLEEVRSFDCLSYIYGSRTRTVNLDAYFRYKTVEFRQHSGTYDYEKIKNWVIITQGLLKIAAKMVTDQTNLFSYNWKQFEDELNLNEDIKEYIASRRRIFKVTPSSVVFNEYY